MIVLWSLLVCIAGLVLTLLVLFGMGRRVAVGDECDYLVAAKQDDPYAPRPFLRMPLLLWLARRVNSISEDLPLRLLLVLVSLLTVALTAAAGWHLGAAPVALLGASVLLLQPERLILSCHVWPDGLVAFVVAALTFLLVLPVPTSLTLLLAVGGLCALGSMARIDALIVPPIVFLSFLSSGRPVGTAAFALIAGPTLVMVTLWTARNYRRYGIPLPDNTWTFNLMVTESETGRAREDGFALEPLIGETWANWHQVPAAELARRAMRSLSAILSAPWRFLCGVARRLLALCGPDTFVRQMLLPAERAYPDLSVRKRRGLDVILRTAFPLLLSLAVLGCALRRELPPPYTWPALSLFAVAALFFARTRFRVAQLPALSLVAAMGLVELPDSLRTLDTTGTAILLSAPLLLWALLRIRCSEELPVGG